MIGDISNCAERAAAGDRTLIWEFVAKSAEWLEIFKETQEFTDYSIKQVSMNKTFVEWLWKHRHAFLFRDMVERNENQKKGLLTTFLCKIYEFCNKYYVTLHYADTVANRFYDFFRQVELPEEVFIPVHEERAKYVPGAVRVCFVCSGNFCHSVVVPEAERFEMLRDLDEPYIVFHCPTEEDVKRNAGSVEEGNVEEMYRLFGYPSEDRHREDYENLTYH